LHDIHSTFVPLKQKSPEKKRDPAHYQPKGTSYMYDNVNISSI